MLWPIILPMKITFYTMLTLIILLTLAAPLARMRRVPVFLGGLLVALVAFVPSCAVLMKTMDARRFGTFDYKTFEEVQDIRVERYLPPVARDIALNKYAAGFKAKFTVSRAEIDAYMDDVWSRYGDRSVSKRSSISTIELMNPEFHAMHFGQLGWAFQNDMVQFEGPRASNGAGFTLWFSPSKNVAYQMAGYW